MLQLQHRLTPGLLDFESRNSPLLSSQIPISERLQPFCFFHVFFKTGSLPFEKNGLDQTHLFANLNLELVQVQVQVQGFFYSARKDSKLSVIHQTGTSERMLPTPVEVVHPRSDYTS